MKSSSTPSKEQELLSALSGGDNRSLQGVRFVVEQIEQAPALFSVLIEAMADDNPILSGRSADAAEKVSAKYPALLNDHVSKLLGPMAKSSNKAVRWHVAQMIPRLELTPQKLAKAVRILELYLVDESSIVKTFAMQALVDLATRFKELEETVLLHIKELSETGTPAMKARGRQLLRKQL